MPNCPVPNCAEIVLCNPIWWICFVKLLVLLHNSEVGIFKLTHHQKRQLYWIFDLRTIRGCTCHKEHNPYKMLPNDSLHFSICDSANKVYVFEVTHVELNLSPSIGIRLHYRSIFTFVTFSLSPTLPFSPNARPVLLQLQSTVHFSQRF